MAKRDRRERVALDQAYRFYRTVANAKGEVDLYRLANALKTISHALRNSAYNEFKLTIRLWLRIEEALFDKLITTFPVHAAVLAPDGETLNHNQPLPEEGFIEVHPENLRRSDDVFVMELSRLHPSTRAQLAQLWIEHGPRIEMENFATNISIDCTESFCVPKNFIPRLEVVEQEATSGKCWAYQKWWQLYWQAYCAPDNRERQLLNRQMSELEQVWGNLNY